MSEELSELIANAILSRVPIEELLVNSVKGLLEEYGVSMSEADIKYHITQSLIQHDKTITNEVTNET